MIKSIQELTDFAGLAKSYALDFDKLPEQTQKEKVSSVIFLWTTK